MNRLNLTCICISAILAISGCSSTPTDKQSNTAGHQHDHTVDDHSGHDHSHDQASIPSSTATAPSVAAATPDITETPPVANIPAFKFYKVKSGISFSNEDIAKNKKTVFILFDPSCSHCRSEATALGKNYDKIKNVNLYFVSMNDPALMASFLETFAKELVGKPNVEVLYDRNQEFIQKFHVPKQFPANYVYTKEGKLDAYWDGDKKIDEIIAAYTK